MASQFTRSLASAKPGFDFVAAHFQCERNLYSPSNTTGYVNFGSAQNFLHPVQVADFLASSAYEAEDAHYQSFSGTAACRDAIAWFLNFIANEGRAATANAVNIRVAPENILVGNGIISVLEALAIALLDPEDCVLVPTPVFPGLVNALSVRVTSGVHLMHTTPETEFRLTPAALERELAEHAKSQRIRAILLSSPGNPIGQVYDQSELAQFLRIAKEFECALIVDEVYAGSCFEGTPFCSAVRLQDDDVYVLGGLSKDFGLAGFATGWVHGTNPDVMKAVAKQAHFYRLPAPVQRIIQNVLTPQFVPTYLNQQRSLLTARYQSTVDALKAAGITSARTEAGLCVWMDLRRHLRTLDGPGELAMYEYLLNEHRVHVSPSSGFLTPERGFFRMCFSHQAANLHEGLKRIDAGIRQWKLSLTVA